MNKTKIKISMILLMAILSLSLIIADECVGGECDVNTNLIVKNPHVDIIYPVSGGGGYTAPVTILNYTMLDLTFTTCWYSTDNGLTNSTPVIAGTPFTGLSYLNGYNDWILYCNDGMGNETYTETYFLINITQPSPITSSVQQICAEGEISMGDAATLAGLILTIILIGTILSILVLSFTGVIDFGKIESQFTIDNLPAGIIIVAVTYLLLATMAYVLGQGVCGSLT